MGNTAAKKHNIIRKSAKQLILYVYKNRYVCCETKQTWPQFNSHEIMKDIQRHNVQNPLNHWPAKIVNHLGETWWNQVQNNNELQRSTKYWFSGLCDIPPRMHSKPHSQRLHPQAVVPGKRLRMTWAYKGTALESPWHINGTFPTWQEAVSQIF